MTTSAATCGCCRCATSSPWHCGSPASSATWWSGAASASSCARANWKGGRAGLQAGVRNPRVKHGLRWSSMTTAAQLSNQPLRRGPEGPLYLVMRLRNTIAHELNRPPHRRDAPFLVELVRLAPPEKLIPNKAQHPGTEAHQIAQGIEPAKFKAARIAQHAPADCQRQQHAV